MSRKVECIVFICLTLIVFTAVTWASERGVDAVSSAEKWLGMVDGGKYVESWKAASDYFRNSIKMDQWEQTLIAVRKPLGKCVKRKLKSQTYETSLPGAPDGEYVVILFETSFENKKSAVETVTPMKGKDGKWRVAGYYIK
jgi:hypothetical protein